MPDALSRIRALKPEYADVSDEELVPILHEQYTPNLPISKVYKNLGVDDPNAPGNFSRGFSESFEQNKPLAYGLAAGAAAAGESLVGQGGIFSALKNKAVEKKLEAEKAIAETSSENDDVNTAYDKAVAGDAGALLDWAGHSAGYVAGQVVQAAGVSLVAIATITLMGGLSQFLPAII